MRRTKPGELHGLLSIDAGDEKPTVRSVLNDNFVTTLRQKASTSKLAKIGIQRPSLNSSKLHLEAFLGRLSCPPSPEYLQNVLKAPEPSVANTGLFIPPVRGLTGTRLRNLNLNFTSERWTLLLERTDPRVSTCTPGAGRDPS